MKVLQINNHHYIKGGADRVYFNTGQLLEKNGHQVINFSTVNTLNKESIYKDYFVNVKDNRNANLSDKISNAFEYIFNKEAYQKLIKLIEETKPDIAHLHLYYGGLSGSILKALRKFKIPIVQTVHDYRLLCPANAFLDKNNQICEKCKNKSYYQCATGKCLDGNFLFSAILTVEAYTRKYRIHPLDYIDHFIFVSRFSQNKHIDFNPRYRDKSSHLYNFTSTRNLSGSLGRRNHFLYFGRLSPEKGLTTLLDVAIKNKIQLTIAGTGPLQQEVQSTVENNKNIKFLGHQSGNELTNLIQSASFIIVPSEWYENNPMTIIEAYSLGKPVIGANIGGIPEIVIENKTGFLFQSRNSLELGMIIEKANQLTEFEYTEMCENAKEFAQLNFFEDAHYEKLMQLYTKTIKNV